MAKVDSNNLRHYEPHGDRNPPCGATDGWWIKTPRYVTCPRCQKHLPKIVHQLATAGKSRCGVDVTAATATTESGRVSCSRCIPRPSRVTKTVHMRWQDTDPTAPSKAVCNLPYAALFSDDPNAVTCGLCQARWSPVCKYCRNEKPSREPVCRRAACRQMHRKEMMSFGRRSTVANPTPET